MKKTIVALAFAFVLAACNNGGDEGQGGDADTTGNTPAAGIQNPNGNIPDTSNAMRLSTNDSTAHRPVDSITTRNADTVNRKK